MMKLKPLIVLAILLIGATGVALAAEAQPPAAPGGGSAVVDGYGDAGDVQYRDDSGPALPGDGQGVPAGDDGSVLEDHASNGDEASSDDLSDAASQASVDDGSSDGHSGDTGSADSADSDVSADGDDRS